MENRTGEVSENRKMHVRMERRKYLFMVGFIKTPVNYLKKRVKSSSLCNWRDLLESLCD